MSIDKIERAVKASEAAQVAAEASLAKLNAELVLTETGGTLTADGSEQNIYINNAPVGVYKPTVIMIDLDNMLAADGDVTDIRIYYRLTAAGGLQLFDYYQYSGDDGGLSDGRKIIGITLLPNRFGVKVTLEQSAVATYKNYDWNVIYEA